MNISSIQWIVNQPKKFSIRSLFVSFCLVQYQKLGPYSQNFFFLFNYEWPNKLECMITLG